MQRHDAFRIRWLPALLVSLLFVGEASGSATSNAAAADGAPQFQAALRVHGTGSSFRPDGWIKLCGQSTGCVIDPLPHPWLGQDVYNASGRGQTVAVDVNEGEDVRFWVVVQNDGTDDDTFVVQGCRGTSVFEVRSVVLGKWRRPDASATNVTRRYKRGTLSFDLAPNKKAVFTIAVVTHRVKKVTYRCLTRFRSTGDPSSEDTVVAKMTTF